MLGTVDERGGFVHKIMLPPGRSGVVRAVRAGDVTVVDPVVTLDDGDPISLMQRWPVRRPRPVASRVEATRPFLTGQRVFDFSLPGRRGRHRRRARAASARARR